MIIELLYSFIKFRSISIKAYFINNIFIDIDYPLIPYCFIPIQLLQTKTPLVKAIPEKTSLVFSVEILLEEISFTFLTLIKHDRK